MNRGLEVLFRRALDLGAGAKKVLEMTDHTKQQEIEAKVPTDTAFAELFAQPASLTNYLCNWSERLRYVYVETPKVACTTIKLVLQQAEAFGEMSYERPGDVHNRQLSPLLAPSDNVKSFVSATKSEDYFRFCFVRNPYTRVLSCYLDKMVKTEFERKRLAPKLGLDPEEVPSFKTFLQRVSQQSDDEYDIHWAPQTYLLRPNRIRYSFIGRFELFREQFKMVCDRLDISAYAEDLGDTWHATNAFEKTKEYLGAEEIELICRIYERDFSNFGYGWSPEVI